MLSRRLPIAAATATAIGLGTAVSIIAGSIITDTPQSDWLDNSIVACLPGIIAGIVIGHVAISVAGFWPKATRGFALYDLEKALPSWSALPLLATLYWSRPAFMVGCAVLWGAFYYIRHAMTDERGRLSNLAADRIRP
jgi:hypothetical protein